MVVYGDELARRQLEAKHGRDEFSERICVGMVEGLSEEDVDRRQKLVHWYLDGFWERILFFPRHVGHNYSKEEVLEILVYAPLVSARHYRLSVDEMKSLIDQIVERIWSDDMFQDGETFTVCESLVVARDEEGGFRFGEW